MKINEILTIYDHQFTLRYVDKIFDNYKAFLDGCESERDLKYMDVLWIDDEKKSIYIDLETIYEIFFEGDAFYMDLPFFDMCEAIKISKGKGYFEIQTRNNPSNLVLSASRKPFYILLDKNAHHKIESFLSSILPHYFEAIKEYANNTYDTLDDQVREIEGEN